MKTTVTNPNTAPPEKTFMPDEIPVPELDSWAENMNFDDEFFQNLDYKFSDKFFSGQETTLSPDQLAESLEKLKNAEDLNSALRPSMQVEDVAKNAFHHLVDSVPEDSALHALVTSVDTITSHPALLKVVEGVGSLFGKLF